MATEVRVGMVAALLALSLSCCSREGAGEAPRLSGLHLPLGQPSADSSVPADGGSDAGVAMSAERRAWSRLGYRGVKPCSELEWPTWLTPHRLLRHITRWGQYSVMLVEEWKIPGEEIDGTVLEVTRGREVVCRYRFGHYWSFDLGSDWGCDEEWTDEKMSRIERASGSGTVDATDLEAHRRARAAQRWLAVGQDFTGRGIPNLTVFAHHGGNAGRSVLHVFELIPPCRLVLKHEYVSPMHSSEIVDLDGDGVPEILGYESFAIWETAGDWRLAAKIILRQAADRLVLYRDRMREPPWPRQRLLDEAATHRGRQGWPDHPSIELAQRMLDLIYSGNAAQARELAGLAWNGKSSPEGFYRKLITILKGKDAKSSGSRFFDGLEQLNGGKL